jgi:hypothetical protein
MPFVIAAAKALVIFTFAFMASVAIVAVGMLAVLAFFTMATIGIAWAIDKVDRWL